MAAIVAGTERAGEVEALARKHLIEREVDKILFWRRWSCRLDDPSAAVVGEALASGRGVVVERLPQRRLLLAIGAPVAGAPARYSRRR